MSKVSLEVGQVMAASAATAASIIDLIYLLKYSLNWAKSSQDSDVEKGQYSFSKLRFAF